MRAFDFQEIFGSRRVAMAMMMSRVSATRILHRWSNGTLVSFRTVKLFPLYSELPLGFNLPMLKRNPGVSSDLASCMCLSSRVQESLVGFASA